MLLAASRSKVCASGARAGARWVVQAPSNALARKTATAKSGNCTRRATSLPAQILPGSTSDTQTYMCGSEAVEVPKTAVQQLPEPAQAAVFAALFASLSLGTWALLSASDMAWAHSSARPYILGATFTLAGIAHFTAHDAFCSMMPTRGAWGIWYLPGSDSFHVNWSGVAEAAGGLGLILGTIPAVSEAAPWLSNASALGLFALAVAVTPANIFMATHNAPGPGPKGAVVPIAGHAVRGILQVVLWAVLWDLAHQ